MKNKSYAKLLGTNEVFNEMSKWRLRVYFDSSYNNVFTNSVARHFTTRHNSLNIILV